MSDLSTDRPTAAELLEIIAETLSESVVPATEPHAQHQARVAANLCRILGRELTSARVDGPDVAQRPSYDEVLELVRSKLDVVKPGYDAHDAEAEANVIA